MLSEVRQVQKGIPVALHKASKNQFVLLTLPVREEPTQISECSAEDHQLKSSARMKNVRS